MTKMVTLVPSSKPQLFFRILQVQKQYCPNFDSLIVRVIMPNIISDLMHPKIFALDIDGTITDTKGGRVDLDLAKKFVTQNNLPVELSDSHYAFHINSKGINKAKGLQEVMDMFSVTKDDVISIGDSETDVPLFKATALSVALGNAAEDVKSQATMTVAGNAGDGVIEALEYIELQLSRE